MKDAEKGKSNNCFNRTAPFVTVLATQQPRQPASRDRLAG